MLYIRLTKPQRTAALLVLLAFAAVGCSEPAPLTPERLERNDLLFDRLKANVARTEMLQDIVEIDHARMGQEAGSTMPPARVLIFSNPWLESAMIQANPLAALDLPLRALAYESPADGSYKLIYNRFDYLASRYRLGGAQELRETYRDSMAVALAGISEADIASFENPFMQPDGITTITSPFDFDKTIERVMAAINSQDDTVNFGTVDFKTRAAGVGVSLAPATMILFGAPGPGAKAMSSAPTLGLDAFCQKFLVWQDDSGQVLLSYNDLLALAERQGVAKSIPLRVINFRLNSVFGDALSE